ncbi:hypothetical protein CVN68_13175 [Sphingomonas psychrotolerans]|uniref:Uncharacterized protein n=2 Tax=Sphingomonas psychrotolerans TaxID=1327635 RepID=A0A2K8MLZ1_9SPHN|nr:hypothetical protein CVN68_13175 [Sphingomonas psychrotolerans]
MERLPMLLAFLLVQAVSQDRNLVPGGDEDGTRTTAAAPRCDSAAEDIVVCGTADPGQFRLKKIEPRYVEPPVRAAKQVGPGELSAELERREFPGASSRRAMLRFRIPLGAGKPK